MQWPLTRYAFNIWLSARGPTLRKKFFWSSPVFGRKILQKSQNAWGSTQGKFNSGNDMVCRRNYLLYIFSNNNSLSPRQFSCNKIPVLLKKISNSKGNAHWKTFRIERAWALWPYMYFYNCFFFFSWQNNNLWGKYSTGLLFTAKILQEAMHFTFPIWAKSLTKLSTITARF